MDTVIAPVLHAIAIGVDNDPQILGPAASG